MRRALLALLLLTSPAAAQTIVQLPGVTYAPGALRVASSVASGCPLTSCVPTSLSVADDGAFCVCDSGGSWVEAGGGGGGIDPALATVADQVLYSTAASTWAAATIATNQLVGKAAIGAVGPLTASQVRTILNVSDGADVTDSVTVGAAGALMATTCAGADTVWGCTADDTAAILTPAQIRAAASLTTHSEWLYPGVAGATSATNATLSDPVYSTTNRGAYARVTGSASAGTVTLGWAWLVPATYTGWETTAITVGQQFSDTGGNNALSLTCKDTAGVTVLNAAAITPSTLYAWSSIASASFSAGTYTPGGVVSCQLVATTDNTQTVDLYGLRLHWTH